MMVYRDAEPESNPKQRECHRHWSLLRAETCPEVLYQPPTARSINQAVPICKPMTSYTQTLAGTKSV
jgi:hypothetical protein